MNIEKMSKTNRANIWSNKNDLNNKVTKQKKTKKNEKMLVRYCHPLKEEKHQPKNQKHCTQEK